ncbi:LOW QUALITY PROTEIN: heparan sulfate glucosamine 3-O-sulfotransferase 3A1 [Elysia marginata]|uniref:Heparan sulfate glucosamine 3-O-sulfotransferase 3A1 n=1 Tax=Elysia marginata TaxID=1093978 RepID=A0AAV4G0G2_9GAST|nr:LOW QUALITY PROTEIN: heparan sulfate glucosamine 3-O-sulfotransferase 3A1 [Elysia marginata]
MFLQDPNKNHDSVRDRLKLQHVNLQAESFSGSRDFGSISGHQKDIDFDSSLELPVSQSRMVATGYKSSVSPPGIPRATNSLEKLTSHELSAKTSGNHSKPAQPTASPPLEKRPRFPKALIIGFSKCGTAALRTFLTIHPDVVSPIPEIRYFTFYFSNGPEWYRRQMPPSTAEQLTIEKSPFYIMSNESLRRIKDFEKLNLSLSYAIQSSDFSRNTPMHSVKQSPLSGRPSNNGGT